MYFLINRKIFKLNESPIIKRDPENIWKSTLTAVIVEGQWL